LSAVEAVEEVNVVLATDSEIAGHVPVAVLARQVNAAHIGTVPEDAGEARASALLTGFNHFNHLNDLCVIQVR
jgi:hypothetical protein